MKGPLILIVDDDPSARAALAEVLVDLGYETASAANGRDAIEFLYVGRPALIILDLVMPDMNGAVFHEWLRADRRHSGTPVLLVSAAEPPPELAAWSACRSRSTWTGSRRPWRGCAGVRANGLDRAQRGRTFFTCSTIWSRPNWWPGIFPETWPAASRATRPWSPSSKSAISWRWAAVSTVTTSNSISGCSLARARTASPILAHSGQPGSE